MNTDHVNGRLKKMKIGQQLEGTPTQTLILQPLSSSPKDEKKKSKRRERKSRGGEKASDFDVDDEL